MSAQASEYLAEAILDHLRSQPPEPGRRYHLHVENEAAVKEVFDALLARGDEPFDSHTYSTKAVLVGGTKLVFAASCHGTTEGFLTFLRNRTAKQDGDFRSTALLIVHDTSLDSIFGGAESLSREGNPVHVGSLQARLRGDIQHLGIHRNEAKAITVVLDEVVSDLHGNSGSVLSLAPFMEIVHKGKVETEDWNELGLFPDPELSAISPKKVQSRVEDNRKWFEVVQASHRYGEPEKDLERDFTRTGIGELRKDCWALLPYGKVAKWHAERAGSKPPKYLGAGEQMLEGMGLKFWERDEGDSASGQRKRHIVIFNPDGVDCVEFPLRFDRTVSGAAVSVLPKNAPVTYKTVGTQVQLTIRGCDRDAVVVRVRYDDPEATGHYEFNVAVVPFGPGVLHTHRTSFEVNGKTAARRLRLAGEGQLVFNGEAQAEERLSVGPGMTIEISDGTKTVVEIEEDDSDAAFAFAVSQGGRDTPCELRQDVSKPVRVTGANIWKWKRERGRSFEFVGENKLVFGNDEYFVNHHRTLCFLELEREIVEQFPHDCFWLQTKDGLAPKHVDVDKDLRRCLDELIGFYARRKLLPSLASTAEAELADLMSSYVDRYFELLGEIDEGKTLRPSERDLLRVGAIEQGDGDPQFLMTPLHPLNVAYQLAVLDTLGREELPNEILTCLSPRDLVPFVNAPSGNGPRLSPVMETELPEWTVYRPYDTSHRAWQNDYVHALVADKIREYAGHFPFLWTSEHDGALRINLVNLGDCVDALKGIIRFFRTEIETHSGNESSLPAIRVCAYGPQRGTNSFADFGLYTAPESLCQHFEIELKTKSFDALTVLKTIRQKVRFYVKGSTDQYEYAHLTFFRFEGDSIEWSYHEMATVPTGCALDGLLDAVPSIFSRGQYASGFGSRHAPVPKPLVVSLAERLNALARVAHTTDPYASGQSVCSVVPDQVRSGLDRVYASSNWVTFIEPRVDLNFFKNSEETGDLVIIHYSDQYTNTSGYDAITVTRKSQQYRTILREFTEERGLSAGDVDGETLLGMFNAINGNWLLRLLSGRGHFSREKVSILSAVKAMFAILRHDDFVWVPLSLEEVLRVSGNVGLKQSEGLFSKHSLGLAGVYCDDLLMVGIERLRPRPKLHFLPVEVKIGQATQDVLKKGKQQGAHTAEALRKFLCPEEDTFRARFYRAFFAKLAVATAQKFSLYGLVPEQDWSVVTDVLRCELLNDRFELCWDLRDFLGDSAVVVFDREAFKRSAKRQDDCLLVSLLESDGGHHLGKTVDELHALYASPDSTMNEEVLLCNWRRDSVVATPDRVAEDSEYHEMTGHKSMPADERTTGAPLLPQPTVVARGMRIVFGRDVNSGTPIHWCPNDTDAVMHTNTGIVGTMGTGKTQFTKSLVSQLVWEATYNVNETKLGFLIFDYKGDYIKDDFVEATGAKRLDLYHLPYNPLALTVGQHPQPMLPLHTANAIRESIATAFGLGQVQRQKLRDILMAAYAMKGIDKGDRSTWDRPPPTLADACQLYVEDDSTKQDSLYAAIDNLSQFEIFEPDPGQTVSLWDLLDGVVVVNLSGYSPDIQNLVVAITLDQFYMQMQKAGHSAIQGNLRELRKMVLVDEADNFLSQGFDAIRKILKEGREFGVGTILSTQFLNHFSTGDSEYANYILTWVVHRVTDLSVKNVPVVFGAQPKEATAKLVAEGTRLDKHMSLANVGDGKPVMMRDRAFWELLKSER